MTAAEGWGPAVAAYLETARSGDGSTLVIGVPPRQAEAWEQRIGRWLSEHGYDPESIPDIELVETTPDSLVSLYRQATTWLETADPLGRALAPSLGIPARQFPATT